MRPLIGISCDTDFCEGSRVPIYCNNQTYVHAVEDAGGMPILIPLLNDLGGLDSLLPRLDGLLLPGGVDVHPSWYGEEPHARLGYVEPRLDALEFALVRWALREDMPVLGICRGLQVLNVALGGSLYQDLDSQHASGIQHLSEGVMRTQVVHRVNVDAGSRMAEVLGTCEFGVNSLHHQAIKVVGKGVRVSGRAEDGVAELLEVPEYRFVMAVQCHAEEIYRDEPVCTRLFGAFVKACGVSAGKCRVISTPLAPT